MSFLDVINKTFYILKHLIKYCQHIDTCVVNESTLNNASPHVSTARGIWTAQGVWSSAECNLKLRGVQLYKNNACMLLSRILSIINSDWLQHVHSVRAVYESGSIQHYYISLKSFSLLLKPQQGIQIKCICQWCGTLSILQIPRKTHPWPRVSEVREPAINQHGTKSPYCLWATQGFLWLSFLATLMFGRSATRDSSEANALTPFMYIHDLSKHV